MNYICLSGSSNIFEQVKNKDFTYFLLTSGSCDCDTPIGSCKVSSKTLDVYVDFLQTLSKCKSIKYFGLLKHFYSGMIVDEQFPAVSTETIHIDNIDKRFLAKIKEDTIYKIQYYKQF
jgi:hypothetical protein